MIPSFLAALSLIITVAVWGLVNSLIVLSFYRAYYRQMQRNLGKDPDAVIRKEFPWIWWLF